MSIENLKKRVLLLVDKLCYRSFIILFFLTCNYIKAQNKELYQAIINIEGLHSIEDLDEDIITNYLKYYKHKINLNLATKKELERSGLFSSYQIATLLDYIDRNGSIYSFRELEIVDGFNPRIVSNLKSFTSLSLYENSSNYIDNEIYVGYKSKFNNSPEFDTKFKLDDNYSYKFKYNFNYKDRLGLNLGMKSVYQKPREREYSASIVYSGQKWLDNLILGDYYLNLGQGLILWNSFNISGIGYSIVKTNSGIKPYKSYYNEDAHRGVALEVEFNKLKLGAATAMKSNGILSSVFARYSNPRGHLGFQTYLNLPSILSSEVMTSTKAIHPTKAMNSEITENPLDGVDAKISIDGRYGYKGLDLFGEFAFDYLDLCPAAILGARYNFSSILSSLAIRYYPSNYDSEFASGLRTSTKTTNEIGLCWANNMSCGEWVALRGKTGLGSSVQKHRANVSLDLVYHPEPKSDDVYNSKYLKFLFNYYLQLNDLMEVQFKLSERLRTYSRNNKTEFRLKYNLSNNVWLLSTQANLLYSKDLAYLFYIDGGYKSKSFNSYLRGGYFKVDNWDDRIYVYERDAPGAFNVPAYYNRGLWFALTSSYTFTARNARTANSTIISKLKTRNVIKIYFRSAYKTYCLMDVRKCDERGGTELNSSARKPDNLELSLFITVGF